VERLLPGIPVLPVTDYRGRIDKQVRAARVPLKAHFELTYRCNFDCVHCYVVTPGADGELSTEEIKSALDQLAELGTLHLSLSGGEVFVHPDFAEIYLHAKRLGFLITLLSNGALLKDRLLNLLTDYPPAKIEITLYGSREDSYAAVTQRKNMHALVLRNVDRLLEREIPVVLKAVALSLNHEDLAELREEARRRGLLDEFRYDAVITERIDCRRGPTDYRLTVEDVLAKDRLEPKRNSDFVRLYAQGLSQAPRARRIFRCQAGISSVVIDPYGKVQTCVLYRIKGGDLRERSLREIWEETIPQVVAQSSSRPRRCDTCEKHVLCNACAGNNALESGGDPEQPSDYHCAIAHARVEAFCQDLVSEPPGRSLPLHRPRPCQRPWLHAYRPLPAWISEVRSPRRRRLPVVTS
jgi:radical SAM protein with 4Fe4S-binding SPASM domain